MRSISIYALTRNQNTDSLSKLERQLSGREYFLKIREWELQSMKALVRQLELHMTKVCSLRFFYSYQIPKLGKEFDLLQIKDDQIINIELKSGAVSEEAIRKQLMQNRYYLSVLGRSIQSYTYISSQNRLVRLTSHDHIAEGDWKTLAKALQKKSCDYTGEIEKLLDLSGIVRMEAFDISNTNGFASVGSMVVYEKGKPKRNDYRKFKIKGVQGADDYASMEEVLTRRFEHGLKERQDGKELGSFHVFPDLIMMDGGKGQVNVALAVLDKLHLQIPVCGMVKDDNHRTRGLYYNNIEIPIDRNSEGFKLITRIQDEAHRFAIEFHRKLRSQGQVHSILDDIPGIGQARRKALMKHFMNLDAIKNASVEELKNLPSMNEKSAKDVYNFFH